MSSEEVVIFIALLTAFCITVAHPFLVGSCIAAFVGYIRYFAPKLDAPDSIPPENTLSEPEQVYFIPSGLEEEEEEEVPRSWGARKVQILTSEPEDVEEVAHIEKPVEQKKKKSQKEILAEIQEAEEREKYTQLGGCFEAFYQYSAPAFGYVWFKNGKAIYFRTCLICRVDIQLPRTESIGVFGKGLRKKRWINLRPTTCAPRFATSLNISTSHFWRMDGISGGCLVF
ncbi:hypothetical protein Y032_0262g573 [Ancylostoma ceylanicum]|uniref:Uncharacterized protein n=1 Tax=Ancylostoma ceylanicum TaxID=53326 RepID=A0A016S9Z4_9BILA|nr:hypothetical protein Y032_0262g573 [Ancylostoma ceylanicum]